MIGFTGCPSALNFQGQGKTHADDLAKRGWNPGLTDLHALMAPRPFFVSGGSEDPPSRWESLGHAVAVNRLLGVTHRVGMTNRPEHTPNARDNELLYRFFEDALKKGP